MHLGRCRRPRLVAVGALTVLLVAAVSCTSSHHQAPPPAFALVATHGELTVPMGDNGITAIDPQIWTTVQGPDVRLEVARASYEQPVRVRQIQADGSRTLPSSILDGWRGLRNFLQITIRDARGQVVTQQPFTTCPNSTLSAPGPGSTADGGPADGRCSATPSPFTLSQIWEIGHGKAVNPFDRRSTSGSILGVKVPLGDYRLTETITDTYRKLFGLSAADATATISVHVVKPTRRSSARSDEHMEEHSNGTPPLLPATRTITNPPAAALPKLIALPSWDISASHAGRQDLLNFGASVWNAGNSSLDVEGFRIPNSTLMKAYQYFKLDGKVIGRAPVGTMKYDVRHGHHHWHYQEFARYRLLDSHQKIIRNSGKVGFCITPSEPIDLVRPHAVERPAITGFAGQCGSTSTTRVHEEIPVGWADTYLQAVAGQSFDITAVPNGVYYIQVAANPFGKLITADTDQGDTRRKIVLGGTSGHRTVQVPALYGLDTEG